MNQGLFESLSGSFADGASVDSVPAASRRMRSIMDHLNRMFNTRAGSLAHLPEYGLPDISEIYRRLPDGMTELRDAIRLTVEKYEPRLRRVKVVEREREKGDIRLSYLITAEFAEGGAVRFQTTFTGTGNSSVSPWKRVD